MSRAKLSEIRADVDSGTGEKYHAHDRACNFYSGLPKWLRVLQKKFGEDDGRIPAELVAQLVGQTLGPRPLTVVYQGTAHVVSAVGIDDCVNPPVGRQVEPTDRITQLWIVEAEYIDLDA